MPTYKKLTAVQIIEANQFFSQHLKRLEGGLVEYDDGCDDSFIANAMDVSVNCIANLRLKLYGKTKLRRAPSPSDDRLDAIERKLACHDLDIARLEADFKEKLRYEREKHDQFRERITKKLWNSAGVVP